MQATPCWLFGKQKREGTQNKEGPKDTTKRSAESNLALTRLGQAEKAGAGTEMHCNPPKLPHVGKTASAFSLFSRREKRGM
ncbi:uncharacterized protein SPSK_10829 [Sporothrix schenckii 1099-18]|uniref:Uncharacterized protein n=1 Tax=Sporothrix schenckii 1099-18 TaxID=1397361 RepID=A0A0F2MGK7_SPOSC|nr:uncharacterized protein SPSK_10829 [Sporothrix schenckii 1099-18]KJR88767.1 hypothetical protein SPSK_10829 [Sporothrix schenckii 1099-18]